MPDASPLDQLAINTIRLLAADAVQKAKSGHPGTPMGAAPTAYTLWQRYLRYDPTAPEWMNRNRFVLSVGHASMLLYALIHLAGVHGMSVDQEGNLYVAEVDAGRVQKFVPRKGANPDFLVAKTVTPVYK